MSHSTKSYICVQGWGEEVNGVTVGPLVGGTGVDTVEGDDGITTSDLGQYTRINTVSSATAVEFTTDLDLNPVSADYDGKITVALIGIRIQPSSEDSVIRGTIIIGSEEYNSAAVVYGQEMRRGLPVGIESHELIGSGVANLVFHDLPSAVIGSSVQFRLELDQASSLGSKRIYIGSVFVGLQIEIETNPNTLTWSSEVRNDRFTTRGLNNISSNGVVQRSVMFEAQLLDLSTITGMHAGFYTDDESLLTSIFRAVIASIGQPALLSIWPYPQSGVWPDSPTGADIDNRMLSARQNFMAVYGLLERRTDITLDQYRDGVNTVYRSRMRMTEIR